MSIESLESMSNPDIASGPLPFLLVEGQPSRLVDAVPCWGTFLDASGSVWTLVAHRISDSRATWVRHRHLFCARCLPGRTPYSATCSRRSVPRCSERVLGVFAPTLAARCALKSPATSGPVFQTTASRCRGPEVLRRGTLLLGFWRRACAAAPRGPGHMCLRRGTPFWWTSVQGLAGGVAGACRHPQRSRSLWSAHPAEACCGSAFEDAAARRGECSSRAPLRRNDWPSRHLSAATHCCAPSRRQPCQGALRSDAGRTGARPAPAASRLFLDEPHSAPATERRSSRHALCGAAGG